MSKSDFFSSFSIFFFRISLLFSPPIYFGGNPKFSNPLKISEKKQKSMIGTTRATLGSHNMDFSIRTNLYSIIFHSVGDIFRISTGPPKKRHQWNGSFFFRLLKTHTHSKKLIKSQKQKQSIPIENTVRSAGPTKRFFWYFPQKFSPKILEFYYRNFSFFFCSIDLFF